MDTKITPLPWARSKTFGQLNCQDDKYMLRDADAAFIVKAVNTHDQWAKWIVQRGPGLPDHACAECVPGGEIVKAGFQCVYHQALAAAEGK